MRIARCFLAPLLLFLSIACDRSAPGRGTREAEEPSPRVCAVSPALSQMLVDLGLGDTIVGRHRFDATVPQHIPVIGDQTELDYEVLLAVRPTDVLLQYGERAIPPRLQRLAREHGWNVHSFDIDMSWDITRVLEALPHLLSFSECEAGQAAREAAHERAAEWVRRLDNVLGPSETIQHAGPLLLIWSIDPTAAFGPDSFIGDVVERMGGENVLRSGAYPELTLEDVLELDPRTILLFADDETETPARARLGRLASLDIEAVRRDRLALVQDRQVLIPATTIVRVAEKIKSAVGTLERDEERMGNEP